MDREIQKISEGPDYKRIYTDLINLKYREKEKYCRPILSKKQLSVLDIIRLSEIISSKQEKEIKSFNQKHRAYNEQAILQMLNYQVKNRLNNNQLASHFKLSRNTVAKWKKTYKITDYFA